MEQGQIIYITSGERGEYSVEGVFLVQQPFEAERVQEEYSRYCKDRAWLRESWHEKYDQRVPSGFHRVALRRIPLEIHDPEGGWITEDILVWKNVSGGHEAVPTLCFATWMTTEGFVVELEAQELKDSRII